MCRPKSSRLTVFLLLEPNREAQQQLRNAVPSEAAGMETRGISREGTASQALYDVPHTTAPKAAAGWQPDKGGSAPKHRGATPADTTAGRLSATAPHGDTKQLMGTGRKKPEFGVRTAAIPESPPPPLPPSAPRARQTPRARLPLRAAEPPLRDPAGGYPPSAFLLPLCPHGAQTSSRSSAGTCRPSPHSPLRCRTTTAPEPAR